MVHFLESHTMIRKLVKKRTSSGAAEEEKEQERESGDKEENSENDQYISSDTVITISFIAKFSGARRRFFIQRHCLGTGEGREMEIERIVW